MICKLDANVSRTYRLQAQINSPQTIDTFIANPDVVLTDEKDTECAILSVLTRVCLRKATYFAHFLLILTARIGSCCTIGGSE
jgi:hypothetical protein